MFQLLCPLKVYGREVQSVNFEKSRSVLITGSLSYRNLETWFVLESRSRGRPWVLSNFLHLPKQKLLPMQALSACLKIVLLDKSTSSNYRYACA